MALLGARLVRKLSKRVLSESKQLEERADRLEKWAYETLDVAQAPISAAVSRRRPPGARISGHSSQEHTLAHHVLEMPLNGPDDNALLELAVFMQMKRFLHNQARATTALPHHATTARHHGHAPILPSRAQHCVSLADRWWRGGGRTGSGGLIELSQPIAWPLLAIHTLFPFVNPYIMLGGILCKKKRGKTRGQGQVRVVGARPWRASRRRRAATYRRAVWSCAASPLTP